MERTAKEIPGLIGEACDLSKREDIEQMIAAAAETMGGIDVLVNNGGIPGPTAPVETMDPGCVGDGDEG